MGVSSCDWRLRWRHAGWGCAALAAAGCASCAQAANVIGYSSFEEPPLVGGHGAPYCSWLLYLRVHGGVGGRPAPFAWRLLSTRTHCVILRAISLKVPAILTSSPAWLSGSRITPCSYYYDVQLDNSALLAAGRATATHHWAVIGQGTGQGTGGYSTSPVRCVADTELLAVRCCSDVQFAMPTAARRRRGHSCAS